MVELLLCRPEAALSDFRASLQLNPQFQFSQIGCAEVLTDLGRAEEALDILAPLLIKQSADAWLIAAIAYEEIGESGRMEECINTLNNTVVSSFELQHRYNRLVQLRLSYSI